VPGAHPRSVNPLAEDGKPAEPEPAIAASRVKQFAIN
jgi:hypothetical protein